MLEQHDKDASVMENMVNALVRESSVKNRRPTEITLSGLAVMPKVKSLPSLPVESEAPPRTPLGNQASPVKRTPLNDMDNKARATKDSQPKSQPFIKRQLQEDRFGNNNKSKQSAESWVPDEIRMRSLHRDLMTIKKNFHDTKVLEDSLAREMKRLKVSDLDRARTEEALEATKKIPCGCCMQLFLYVNLPMKISRKAILDLRIKWSGTLTSETMFRGTSARELAESLAETGKSGGKKDVDGMNTSVPRCYEKVGVCVFCAQFFQEPEDYRPSYQSITYNERKAAHFENKRREREYWDPLKMLEKDREMLLKSSENPDFADLG
jgi:hypothetical protein